MWTIEVDGSAVNRDLNRRIFIDEEIRDIKHIPYSRKPFFSVREEWHTSESEGISDRTPLYMFPHPIDAINFIAYLAFRLNTPEEQRIMRLAKEFIHGIEKDAQKEIRKGRKTNY